MITINCNHNNFTETITAPIDILNKSSFFETLYKDTNESTTWDLTNSQLNFVYLKNVIRLMETPEMEISSDIKFIECFIEFLNCADLLLLDDDMNKNICRLINDQVALLKDENLLKIMFHLNNGIKCDYVDTFTKLLLKAHCDELIEFVKNNVFHNYKTVYINNVQLTENMFNHIINSYCDCCIDKLAEKIPQNTSKLDFRMRQVINERRGKLNELHIVY